MTGLPLSDEAWALERYASPWPSDPARAAWSSRTRAWTRKAGASRAVLSGAGPPEAVTGQRHDFETLERFPGWRTVPSIRRCPRRASARSTARVAGDPALAARPEPDALLRELPAHGAVSTRFGRGRGRMFSPFTTGSSARASTSATRPRGRPRSSNTPSARSDSSSSASIGWRPSRSPTVSSDQSEDRGDLAHGVLEATFRCLAESGALPLTRERLAIARDAFDAAFDEATAEAERRG